MNYQKEYLLEMAKKELKELGGFTKKELIEYVYKTERTIFGGRASPLGRFAEIKTQQDIEDSRNALALGNYPLTITDCEVVGMNGDCGKDCPVLVENRPEDCDVETKMRKYE